VGEVSGVARQPRTESRARECAALVIWTTTPWTIPGNRAISFSPKIDTALRSVDAPAETGQSRRRVVLATSSPQSVQQARVTAFKDW
jgi:isoleucyl-tRNA synthetase